MTSTRTPVRRILGLAGLLALAGAPAAHAQSTTFAAFTDGGAQTFQGAVDNGGLDVVTETSPVRFAFSPTLGLPPALLGQQAAHMVVSFTAAGSNNPAASPGSNIVPTNGPVTISYVMDNPYGGLSNLLTVSFTGRLYLYAGGTTGSLQASVGTAGDSITYSSDFLNFSNQTNDNLAIALNFITPTGSQGGFSASQTGSFAALTPLPAPLSDPLAPVPVPPSVVLVSLGLLAPAAAGVRARLRGRAAGIA